MFVQYNFCGKPHIILQKPHGNSKSSSPFIRTTPSTLRKLKDYCKQSQKPKQAVYYTVTSMKGGVVNANMVGDLPRNRQQVYNIKNNESDENDVLLSVMVMCKEGMGKDENSFVRIVTSAPEPMCVLCANYQLDNIQRFCTDPEAFSLLCVDPTFNLGDFSLTVTSYSNLSKNWKAPYNDWSHVDTSKKAFQFLPLFRIKFGVIKTQFISSSSFWYRWRRKFVHHNFQKPVMLGISYTFVIIARQNFKT